MATILERVEDMQMVGYDRERKRKPICVFTESYFLSFFGSCAERVLEVIGKDNEWVRDGTPIEGMPRIQIDARGWNPILEKLQAAGLTMLQTGL